MCRATTDARARRCPCSYGEKRSAVDRARRAAKNAAAATCAASPTPAAPLNLSSPDLQALTQTATAGFVTHAKRVEFGRSIGLRDARAELLEAVTAHRRDPTPENEAARDAARQTVDALEAVVAEWEARLPTVEEAEFAVRHIGNAVASRAEHLAGITAAQAHAEYEQRLAGAIAREAELQARSDALKAELRLNDLRQELDAAVEVRNAAGSNATAEAEAAVTELDRRYGEAYRTWHAAAVDDGLYDTQTETRAIINGSDALTRERKRALADGYAQALSELRPTGGTLTFDSETKSDAAGIFNRAAQVFPSEWIDASNRGQAPLARLSTVRAHYSSSREIKARKRADVTMNYEADTDDPYESLGLSRATAEIVPHPEAEKFGRSRKMWLVTEYEQFSSYKHNTRNGKPTGGGWEQITYEGWGGEQVSTWRRKKFTMQTVAARSAPELTTNSEHSPVGAPGGATATHELTHRMEAVVPMIGLMESAFVERRTTRPDGTQSPLVNLYGKPDERARDGGFTTAYIGKEYGGTTHFEVMSVGTESLFHGEHGGLVGLARSETPDLDHRAFVLGVLATATKK